MPARDELRKEIVEFEKATAELLRWKLLVVGAIAAAALGLSADPQKPRIIVLAVVPFVAAYCDLLCADKSIRIALIASFFRQGEDDFGKYERFLAGVGPARGAWWLLSKSATLGSSLAMCLLVTVAALSQELVTPAERPVLLVSAAIGFVLVFLSELWLNLTHRRLRKGAAKSAT